MNGHIKYEIPYRPIYEFYSSITWLGGSLAVFMLAKQFDIPEMPVNIMAGIAGGMFVVRGVAALTRYKKKSKLSKSGLVFMELKELAKMMPKLIKNEEVYLGRGFEWTQQEAQVTNDIIALGLDRKSEKANKNKKNPGAHWLQYVGDVRDILYPVDHLSLHFMIAGTTGSGKSTLLILLIAQAILREEPVVILDPKGDRSIQLICKAACELVGHPERYKYFSPAFPEKSCRIDPLRNWNRPTEFASRISALISTEAESDAFSAFSWKSLDDVTNGLLATGIRPNLVKFRRYIEAGVDDLTEKALRMYFEKYIKNWQVKAQKYKPKGSRNKKNENLAMLMEFYEKEVVDIKPNTGLGGLISMCKHDRTHFSKMVAGLLPVLTMLTSDKLAGLLSPEVDPDDDRPITDMSKVIAHNQVLYVSLDALSDPVVSGALGSILGSDATAVAGDRYNYGIDNQAPVNFFADEQASLINKNIIELMGKGRSAGFRIIGASQVLSDYVARLGDMAKARQVLGNNNTFISLPTIDNETQQYIAEGLQEVPIKQMGYLKECLFFGRDPIGFSGMSNTGLTTELKPLFEAPMLAKLPTLHYMGKLPGGRLLKGVVPILKIN